MIENFKFDDDPKDRVDMVNILIERLREHNAFGVSAPELGINARLFVLRGEEPLIVFNPRIVDEEGEIMLPEGCYSHPGLAVKIKRPEFVRVRYQDINGETQTSHFGGVTARAFQHEMDHLNGVDFLSKASYYHRDQAKRKLKKINRTIKRAS